MRWFRLGVLDLFGPATLTVCDHDWHRAESQLIRAERPIPNQPRYVLVVTYWQYVEICARCGDERREHSRWGKSIERREGHG